MATVTKLFLATNYVVLCKVISGVEILRNTCKLYSTNKKIKQDVQNIQIEIVFQIELYC